MKKTLLPLLAFILLSLSAFCQWGTDVGTNVPLTQGEGLKQNTLIVQGPDDSWYISYTVATGSNTNVVHLTRVDGSGVILWDNVIHDLSEVGNPRAVMISDMADGVIMAWIDRRVPTNPMVFANRINADGDKLWGSDDLEVGMTEGQQSCPQIVSDGQNGAIVTCRDEGPGDGDFTGIYAHRISAAGSVSWRTFLFPNGNNCDNYSITTDGEGGVVAFTIYGHVLEAENQVRGMRLNANGAKVWPDETFDIGPLSLPIGMRFQGSMDNYSFPRAAFHPLSGIYLVYFHNPLGGLAPIHRGQLIDVDANKLWDEEDVILNLPSELSPEVSLATDLDGNLYFNFHTESSWNVQKIHSDASFPWAFNGIEYSSSQTGAPDNMEITTCNDVMISFDGVDEIIHVTRIDENGGFVYTPDILPLSINELDDQHRDPVISVNENDQVVVVWVDDENIGDAAWQLKMHGFHKDDVLGTIVSVENFSRSDFGMYPNPVSGNEVLVVKTTDIEHGMVTLINSNGKTVMSKANVDFRNGTTSISVPNGLSTGIYFLQIADGEQVYSSKLMIR